MRNVLQGPAATAWSANCQVVRGDGSSGNDLNSLVSCSWLLGVVTCLPVLPQLDPFSSKNQNSKKNFWHLHENLNLDEIKTRTATAACKS